MFEVSVLLFQYFIKTTLFSQSLVIFDSHLNKTTHNKRLLCLCCWEYLHTQPTFISLTYWSLFFTRSLIFHTGNISRDLGCWRPHAPVLNVNFPSRERGSSIAHPQNVSLQSTCAFFCKGDAHKIICLFFHSAAQTTYIKLQYPPELRSALTQKRIQTKLQLVWISRRRC